MSREEYQSTLDVLQLIGELRRLLVAKGRADRLLCRYLADLADRIGTAPGLVMAYGDAVQVVRAKFGLSIRSIRERLRVGRALRTLPGLDAALMSGAVTYSRVREVTRVAKPDTERYWLDAARRLSIRALERRVAEVSGGPGPRARERSGTRVSGDVWGLLEQAMRAARAALGRELSDADALAAVARGAIAHYGGLAANAPRSDTRQSDAQRSDTQRSDAQRSDAQRPDAQRPDAQRSDTRQSDAQRSDTPPSDTPQSSATHSGFSSPGGEGSEGGDAGSRVATHSGSVLPSAPDRRACEEENRPDAAKQVPRDREVRDAHFGSAGAEPLSPDAQLIFDRICAEGPCHMGTLCDVTGIPPNRFACALLDLEMLHLVQRSGLGWYEANLERAG